MYELTVIYPNNHLETFYAPERWMLEQLACDMDGAISSFAIEDISVLGPRNRFHLMQGYQSQAYVGQVTELERYAHQSQLQPEFDPDIPF